jgi:hypothetical protein
MICCKIITDYNNTNASFSKLCELLSKKGDWTWNGDSLFFADTEGSTDEKTIIRCVKKAGYTKVFVNVYDKDNEPHENESIKGWITDKVVKIYYKQFEDNNRAVLLETKKGLDEIEQEVNGLIRELKQQQEESKTQITEDNDNGRED